MEIYRGTVATVEFPWPTTNTSVTSATYSIDGGVTQSTLSLTNGTQKSTATLPYFDSEADVQVTWNFSIPGSGSFSHVDYYNVVTPYLTIAGVKKIYPEATDDEAVELEAAVRHIINAHCGQSFGYAVKTLTVEGHGESALRLPQRLIELISLSTLTGVLNVHRSIVVSDGWFLKKGWTDNVSVLTTTDEYFTAADIDVDINTLPGEAGYEKPDHGYVIVPPSVAGLSTPWRDDYPFTITGKWGYLSVPQPVVEAAKLLVNDYACSEIAYRDRYLEVVKAADWQLEFNTRAWDSTGNVRADQLLDEYVLLDWAVI